MLARLVTGLAMAAVVLLPAPVAAQRAPVFLEAGHWTWDAVRRLSVAGLAPPAADHALAPVTLGHALDLFQHAEDAARSANRPFLSALAAGYRAMLELEGDTAGLLAGSEVRAGWTAARGEARGGDGYLTIEDWEGAQVLPGVHQPAVAWRGHGYIQPWLGWSVDAGYLAGDPVVRSAVVSAAAGPIDVWAGRRPLHYAIGRGGGTVIGGARNEVPDLAHRTSYTFQGIGGHVRNPFRFPGFLHFLGPARIEAALGRMDRVGRVDRPWVAFGRLVGSPFTERLTLGINRGAIFGGEGNPITVSRLAGLIIGLHGGDGGEFENQVFSTLVAFRPPLGPAVPLEFHVEWGMDDTAGAVRDVPAIVAGLDLATVPGLPWLAVALERTSFAESCCGNPIWYRHIFYRGSWADEGRLFAHPLGGHGTEWLAHARVDRPDNGMTFRVDAFRRDRGYENLFAPERTGRSVGGSAAAELRLTGGTRVRLDAAWEHGDNWDSVRATAFLVHTFHLRR